jgi:hypothetical protein
MKTSADKAIRAVLIVTAISALPGLVMLAFGIAEYRRPHDYGRNPDPELSYIIPFYFTLLCVVATFAVSSLVAVAYHFFTRRRRAG